MPWSTERPGQEVYRQAHSNIGKYSSSSLGKPYINPAIPMYVPNDGECCVRIVDPLELLQLQIYYFEVNFHRDVGFRKDYFLCLQRHGIGLCAVCENVSEDLWQSDKEAAKALLPDQRRLIWVLDLKVPAEAHILKLWSAPRSLSDEILAQSRNPELDVIQEVSHPFEGVPVYFMRTGKGIGTKYSGVKLGSAPMPVDESIADQRFNFMDILVVPSYEEVYASYHMEDLPAEANVEAPPVSAYEDQASGYSTAATAPPAHEVGAYEAAAAAVATEAPPVQGEIDYSDRERIQPENVECFRNEFNQYNECDVCLDRELCQQPWPMKPVKKAKPKPKPKPVPKTMKKAPPRIGKPAPPPRATPPATAPTTAGGGAAAGILSAQEKLRAEIAKRKAGQ